MNIRVEGHETLAVFMDSELDCSTSTYFGIKSSVWTCIFVTVWVWSGPNF